MCVLIGLGAVLPLTACTVSPVGNGIQDRQKSGVVFYGDDTVIFPVAGTTALREACDWQLVPIMERRIASPDRYEKLAHFGVAYAKFEVRDDGRKYCSSSMDFNGGSVQEIGPSVAARFAQLEPVGAPCTAVFQFLPKGYDPSAALSIGRIPGQELERRVAADGYGAMAISANGAWSVFGGYATRAQVDESTLGGCIDEVRSGQGSLTEEDIVQIEKVCAIAFRWGPDYLDAELIYR